MRLLPEPHTDRNSATISNHVSLAESITYPYLVPES
jgi:hypothetical protein